MVNEIKQIIDEMSNLKSLRQLELETARAKEASVELEKKSKLHQYRVEQAEARMQKIEEEEKERCRKTAEILKKFQANSCNGPFFESLLDILTNFQGKTLIISFVTPINTLLGSSHLTTPRFIQFVTIHKF